MFFYSTEVENNASPVLSTKLLKKMMIAAGKLQAHIYFLRKISSIHSSSARLSQKRGLLLCEGFESQPTFMTFTIEVKRHLLLLSEFPWDAKQ